MKKALGQLEVWFVTGSQDLYGAEALEQVARNSREIAESLDDADAIPVRVVAKPVVKSPGSIRQVCLEANAAPGCIGVIAWMHTFSPAKMWIAGLDLLQKPLLHFHTQFNRDLPWAEIDMDFMNLNQSAHGDREFGFVLTRMRLARKMVVGHWRDPRAVDRIATWTRAAAGRHEAQTLSVARFGDNMRSVAVTEGDKVEAQVRLGVSVNGYGVGDLVDAIAAVPDSTVAELLDALRRRVRPRSGAARRARTRRDSLRDAARIEAGLRAFLDAGGHRAFTDTFEDLHGLQQLPGLAVQRLMADGYGFGGRGRLEDGRARADREGDGDGARRRHLVHGGLHVPPRPGRDPKVLGAHMLEICPSIAVARPSLRDSPALDRRQGRSGATGVRRRRPVRP